MTYRGYFTGASKLNDKQAEIVVNWAGGMSHARKESANGNLHSASVNLFVADSTCYNQACDSRTPPLPFQVFAT
jgi:hypothetical protein